MIPRFRLLSIKLLPRSVIRLGGFRLDHDRGVAALIKFRLVRDGTNDVAGRESHCGAKGGECCDEHRDDDFENLLAFHSYGCFLKSAAKVVQKSEPTKKVGSQN